MCSDSLMTATTSGRWRIIVGWALAVILVGPGGRHCAVGSLGFSTFLYLSAARGVRINCSPGSVSFEMSLIDPPNQTPVKSGWGPGGWGSPLYHHTAKPRFGLLGAAPRPGPIPRVASKL